MGKEIEKKYLIREDGIEFATDALSQIYGSVGLLEKDVMKNGLRIRQGYLPYNTGMELAASLRLEITFDVDEIRLRKKSDKYYLTLKSQGGLSRSELETEISSLLFDKFWSKTSGRALQKVRLRKPCQGHSVEIDVYTDRDLIVAEVEVPTSKDAEELVPLGKDVSNDDKYKNKNLAR